MSHLETHKPAIVIPAYKRKASLKRLLASINEAAYPFDDIQLIISVEGNADAAVMDIANDFSFKAGNVRLVQHKKHLGLYNHILECADYSGKYGSVIVLEDDLVVGPEFYNYTSKALSFYDDQNQISGIALYSQRFNETTRLPFEPLEDKWSTYFMQIGCSWGQAWTHKQWKEFREWLDNGGEESLSDDLKIPENVKEWSHSSWKKVFYHYLVQRDKYIVYPYTSYSTNAGDAPGENIKNPTNTFQVPLNVSTAPEGTFKFSNFSDESIHYDCFMEAKSKQLEKWIGLSFDDVEMDLYGSKPVDMLRRKKFTITSKEGSNPLQSFPLSFRPIELNLKFGTEPGKNTYLHLYNSKDVPKDQANTSSRYYQLAKYFAYTPIHERSFMSAFINNLIPRFWNKVKQPLTRNLKS